VSAVEKERKRNPNHFAVRDTLDQLLNGNIRPKEKLLPLPPPLKETPWTVSYWAANLKKCISVISVTVTKIFSNLTSHSSNSDHFQ